MLAWKKADGNWLGNGYRIESDPPRSWDLYDTAAETRGSNVTVEDIPLASLPTLSAAKHKAEILHGRAQTASLRRRLLAVAGGSVALMLVLGPNPLLAITCGVVAMASLLELAMTWLDQLIGDARELHQ